MYECKGLMDSEDFEAALATGRATLQVMKEVASDDHALLGRMHVYLATALVGQKRYEEARAELALATEDQVDAGAAVGVQADIDEGTGHANRAIPRFREALEDAKDGVPPTHPDVIASRLELGRALLDHHEVDEARTVLEAALAATEQAELAPIAGADVRFAAARAVWAAGGDKARATALARQALATYVESAAPTRGMEDRRAEIEGWLAKAQ